MAIRSRGYLVDIPLLDVYGPRSKYQPPGHLFFPQRNRPAAKFDRPENKTIAVYYVLVPSSNQTWQSEIHSKVGFQ